MSQASILTLTLTVLVLLVPLAPEVRGSQTCRPRCFPADEETKKDCLVFRTIPTCRTSRFQPYVAESDCACLWRSFFHDIGSAQGFQTIGIHCLAWALRTCEKETNTETKKTIERKLLPEVGSLVETEKTNTLLKNPVGKKEDDRDVLNLLQELNKDARELDDSAIMNNQDTDLQKAITYHDGEKTGEIYGVLNKKAGILHAAERLNDMRLDDTMKIEDIKDMIGPKFGMRKWWFWNIRDDKFKLVIFITVLILVFIFVMLAFGCLSDVGDKKKKDEDKLRKGDLDLDLYKIPAQKTSLLATSDSFTRLEKKRTHFQQFIAKLRVHQQNKVNEFEAFHTKMRKMSVPGYRARQSTPVQTFQKKMVRVGVQTPIYEQVNPPNLSSDDENVIYHRARSPVFSFNNTYEQPFPVYENSQTPREQTYYNVRPKDSGFPNDSRPKDSFSQTYEQPFPTYQNIQMPSEQKNYVRPNNSSFRKDGMPKEAYSPSRSPVPELIETYENLSRQNRTNDPTYCNQSANKTRNYPEVSPQSDENIESPVQSPRGIKVELPSEIDENQRILLPTKGKKKKTKRPTFVILPMSKSAR